MNQAQPPNPRVKRANSIDYRHMVGGTRRAYLKITEVNVGTALGTLCGLRRSADALLVSATKAADLANLFPRDELRQLVEKRRLFEGRRFLGQHLLDTVMLAALAAEG